MRKSTGRENRKRIEGRKIRSERAPFKKIKGRAAAVIKQIIKECQAPLQIPYLLQTLKEKHGIILSGTQLRKYFKQELGMSYRKLGVVGKHYDDHKNLLKRQLAAA